MKVKLLEKDKIENYYHFFKENGTIFISPEWIKIYINDIFLFGFFDNSDNLIGGFYLFKKNNFLKFFKNPPFTPNNGLFYIEKSKNKVKILSNQKKIIELVEQAASNLNFHILSFSLPYQFTYLLPFYWKKYKVVPFYTYMLNLENNEEDMLKDMSTERRNDINRAIKDNIICKKETDYGIVKALILNTFDRKNENIDLQYLESILFNFANTENSFAFVSYLNNIPIATAFCIYDKNTSYYLFGGYDNKNKHQGAGVLAIWNSILESKKLNIKHFDFEGSMIPEVEKYFRDFGGNLVPYYSINKALLPIEIALKFIKRERF